MKASEQSHCNRFCFNGGSCFECARDPYGLAQCVGCLCPQHLWAGERCEFRVGHGGSKSRADINFILACLFASLTILCACLVIHLYFKNRKQFAHSSTESQCFQFEINFVTVKNCVFWMRSPT
uniref:EGF region domain containing protein n=1 Tax=Echinococcus granulosus TaxID=6210 RepID=A0A068W8G6_ECHGR|nr:EGF region domain containing protein [Echinococcus granulosus]